LREKKSDSESKEEQSKLCHGDRAVAERDVPRRKQAQVLAHVSGKMRKNFIRILAGDKSRSSFRPTT